MRVRGEEEERLVTESVAAQAAERDSPEEKGALPPRDEELFEKFQQGDAAAFEELFDRYGPPLFRVIRRMVGSRTEAEDIFQETFYRVIKHRRRFDSGQKFSIWLYTIAANLCRDYRRHESGSPFVPTEVLPDTAADCCPEREAWTRQAAAAAAAAVERLPPDQREVFVLREYAGLSFKEIAQITGANLNTVLARMHLAVKKLRRELAAMMEGRG